MPDGAWPRSYERLPGPSPTAFPFGAVGGIVEGLRRVFPTYP